ncbi:YbaN family protein [Marivibrio halodurans]|uniref:YbaN family protein n=1 Tax=Marivibrio halodurans TaxID=2039722 RepID=A0A8J7SMV6_9PROT|nr:YbaN family protein [Marivibrio halodurans]
MTDAARRHLFFAIGIVATALGFVGVALPIMPTVPFLIVAVWAFSRSSRRFHDWLYHHPTYGPTLRRWDKYRVIPPLAKLWSVLAMAGGLTLTALFTEVPAWAVVGAAVAMTAVGIYICTRPSRPPPGAGI